MSILSLGSATGSQVLENSWFESHLDTSDAWIRQRTGISRRRVLSAEASFKDLCLEAAVNACSGVGSSKVSLVILATTTPDDAFGDATALAAALTTRGYATEGCGALDLRSACCGFVDALQVAAKLNDGLCLVVGADCLSRRVDWDDRATCPLFGDAAAAAVLGSSSSGRGVVGSSMRTFQSDALTMRRSSLIEMRGAEVYEMACLHVPRAIADLAGSLKWPLKDCVLVLHQANSRILRAVGSALGKSVPCHISTLGNTGAASVGLMLAHLAGSRLKKGQKVILCAFGAGFKVSCLALEWQPCPVSGIDDSYVFDEEAVPADTDEEADNRRSTVESALCASLGLSEIAEFDPTMVDSLSSMDFASRLRSMDVSPTLLLEHDTVDSILASLQEAGPVPAPSPEETGDWFAVTSLQHAMLFHHLADPTGAHFVESFEWHVEGDVDVEKLKEAVNSLVRNHSALRSTFDFKGKLPRQRIAPFTASSFEHVVDYAPGARRKLASELKNKVLSALTQGDLLIAVCYHETSRCLLLCVHHLVCDGFSMRVIIDDLISAHNGDLPHPEVNSWRSVSAAMSSAPEPAALAHYRRCLEQATTPKLLRSILSKQKGVKRARERVCRGVAKKLACLARATFGGSVDVLANTAFAFALRADDDQGALVYGATLSTRVLSGEVCVGPLLNTVPVCLERFSGSNAEDISVACRSVAGALQAAREACANTPLPVLVEHYSRKQEAREHSRSVVDVVFDFQGTLRNWTSSEGGGMSLSGGRLVDRAGAALSVRCLRDGDDLILNAVSECGGAREPLDELLGRLEGCLTGMASCVDDAGNVGSLSLGALRYFVQRSSSVSTEEEEEVYEEAVVVPAPLRGEATEATMVALKRAVKAEGIEVEDMDASLIALGLDSLRAMRALASAVADFGAPRSLNLAMLFAHPTIRGIAAQADALCSDEQGHDSSSPFLLLEEEEEEESYPLFGVGAAHFVGLHASSFSDTALAPQIYWEWRFEGAVDVPLLEAAWDFVVARHGTLRATVQRDGTMRVGRGGLVRAQAVREGEEGLLKARLEMRDEATAIGSVFEWPLFALQVTHFKNYSVAHVAMSLFLMDAVSDLTFRSELSRAYLKEQEGPPPQLAFGRYARSLVAGLPKSAAHAKARDFWTARLATMAQSGPALPMLPQKGPVRFKNATVILEPEAWARGLSTAKERGMTMPVALLSCYCLALARHSDGERRFLINVLLCLRYSVHEEAFRVLGNCSSTVLVDIDLRKARTLEEACRSVSKALAESLEHSAFSGIEVMDLLKRHKGTTDFFEAMAPFIFTTPLGVEKALPQEQDRDRKWCFRETHFSERVPHTACVNAIKDDPATGAAHASLDYLEGLFPESVTKALAKTYECILKESLCGSWDADVSALLDVKRRKHEVIAHVDDGRLLQDALEQSTGTEKIALICQEDSTLRRISYAELRSRSRAAAAALENLLTGLDNNDREHRFLGAVVMGKGWRQVVAVHAVLFCGGAYVPVELRLWPESRCLEVLRRSEAQVALVDAEKDWGLPCLTVADFERDHPERAWPAKTAPLSTPQRRLTTSAAYVIYTSGSTGVPKGVVCHHLGALNTIIDCNNRSLVTAEDRILGLSSLAFDLSVYDIFGATMAGACLVLPRASVMSPPDPRAWCDLAEAAQITLWNSVPALLELACVSLEMQKKHFSCLRTVWLSGDVVPLSLPARCAALCIKEPRIVLMGGATEAAIWSNEHVVAASLKPPPGWNKWPYGSALKAQSLAILDESTLEPLEDWVVGGIYIGGVGVALGYHNDPVRSARQFVVRQRDGARFLKTGDLGRLRDGAVEILGRSDAQVKIRGFRLELGEVEHAVIECSNGTITSAAAHLQNDQLVVHAVSDNFEEALIIARLSSRLPSYAVPRRVVLIAKLPLSSNGKLDRTRLPQLKKKQEVEVITTHVGPRDATERAVHAAFQRALDTTDDICCLSGDFFRLGGTSMTALRLLLALNDEFGIELSARTLLDHPTVAGLASQLGSKVAASSGYEVLELASCAQAETVLALCNPAGASGLCYLAFAREVSSRSKGAVGVVALDDGVVSGRVQNLPYESITEAAKEAALLLKFGNRRVIVGGWSYGGVVALEMARLHQVGLFLVDAPISRAVVGEAAPAATASSRSHFAAATRLLEAHYATKQESVDLRICEIVPEFTADRSSRVQASLLLRTHTLTGASHWSLLDAGPNAAKAAEIFLADLADHLLPSPDLQS